MVGSMRSSDSSSSTGGGLNSAGNRASGAGPGASSNRSTTGGGYGSNTSSGGGLNSAGNRASGAGPGASANRSTSSSSASSAARSSSTVGGQVGGGLNSAGNRASGAGPGASSNRSTTGGGFGSGGGQVGGGLNSAGNRASGAGPGASANRSTTGNGFGGTGTGTGFGGQNSPAGMSNASLGGGMMSDSARRADQAQAARASENASMSTYNAGQDKARQANLAQQARASEITSMRDLAREQALGIISKAEVGLKDPYNTLSGGLTADITSMTVREAIAFAKTSWDGKLANVLGAFQTKDTTLAAVAEKMGLLDAKMTPAVQDQIAVGLLQQRANKATVNGQIDVDRFAKEISKEWASMATPTGSSYYAANGIDKASVSYADVRSMAASLVANGVVSPNKSVSSITSKDVSPTQTTAPGISRFASTYMGAKTSSPSSPSSPSFGGMNSPRGVASAPAGTTAASTQQNDPSGLPPGTYQGYDPSGLPPDTPSVRPASPVPATPSLPAAAPVPAAKPAQEPTLGQKLAATAIDVGLGMLPGIGTVASVVNGGLALTGNKTLGEHVVDSINSDGPGAAGSDPSARGYSGNSRGGVVETTVPEQNDESFEDRYIKFVDPTPRPTPAERWNYDTAGYA